MRLSRLRVRGLRSYVRAIEIDLARLGEAGLFAIVGPTGSGKSTILDGIFLALFGRCPRGEPGDCVALGALELDARLEIEIDTEADEAPRAFAIERRFRWTGKRSTTRQFSLHVEERKDGAWLPADTGGRTTEDYLRDEIVRVSMSDFEQAVVLPQGQLDALLRARPAERRVLLSSLFRTERLGSPLHDALRARENEARAELDRLAEEERASLVATGEIEAAEERIAITCAEARAADEALASIEARSLARREAFATRARAADAMLAGAAEAARAAAIEAASALDDAASRDERLRACVDRLADASARIDEARAALAHLTSDRDERDRAHEQERDAARRAAFEAVDRAERALEQRRAIDRRAARFLELRARAALLEPRAQRLAQARLLVSANQLAELAAERHLEAVTRDAAALLRTLSAERYALVRSADGAFAIADSDLGSAARSPSTLSGGETFLVALALALALSERIQIAGRARFDFFFLDEGLGGLDAATLEIALSALERLRGPRRVIGLISHLAAVEERMPHKLRVEPGRGERGVTVRHEIGERPREKSPPGPRRQGMLARQDD